MLWAIMIGDEVQNIYHNLIGINFLLGSFFAFGWVFFSNQLIMPSFLAISEDGYIRQSKTSKFEWLEDNIYNDPEDENHLMMQEEILEDQWSHVDPKQI